MSSNLEVARAEHDLKNARALLDRQHAVITRLAASGADQTLARRQLEEAETTMRRCEAVCAALGAGEK